MAVLKNRAGVGTSTTGTGTITLGAALTSAQNPNAASWQTFAGSGVANGDSVRYLILDSNGAWEYGPGTYTSAGTTLSRAAGLMDGTVAGQKSSTGALLSLTGTAQVFITAVAEDITPVTLTVQKFTASGTYTPTAGTTYAIVELVGGGGGGGGCFAAAGLFNLSAGGGAGAYSRRVLTAAQIGASQTVTIGAAGTGGAGTSTPGNGGNGSDTSFGSLVVAKGGLGGGAAGGGGLAAPGAGGSGAAGTGDLTGSGAPGGGGFFGDSGTYGVTNQGGSSFFGGGGALTAFTADSIIGTNATNYGSGGSGAAAYNTTARAGGNGSAGFVFITEYK